MSIISGFLDFAKEKKDDYIKQLQEIKKPKPVEEKADLKVEPVKWTPFKIDKNEQKILDKLEGKSFINDTFFNKPIQEQYKFVKNTLNINWKPPVDIDLKKPDQKFLDMSDQDRYEYIKIFGEKGMYEDQVQEYVDKQRVERDIEIERVRKELPTNYVEPRIKFKGNNYKDFKNSMIERGNRTMNDLLKTFGVGAETIGKILNKPTIEQFGSKFADKMEKEIAANPEWAAPESEAWKDADWYLDGVSSAVGSMAMYILPTVVGSLIAPGGGTAAGLSITGTLGAGEAYQRGTEEGLSEKEKLTVAKKTTLLYAVAEYIPGATILNKTPGGKKIFNRLMSSIINKGKRFFAAGLPEAVTEPLQSHIINTVVDDFKSNRSDWEIFMDNWKSYAEESFFGFLGGGGMDVAVSATKLAPQAIKTIAGDKRGGINIPKDRGKDLEQEAKKYKTADEFVNNKQKVFHATNKDFEVFDNNTFGATTGAKNTPRAVKANRGAKAAKQAQQQIEKGIVEKETIIDQAKPFDKKDLQLFDKAREVAIENPQGDIVMWEQNPDVVQAVERYNEATNMDLRSEDAYNELFELPSTKELSQARSELKELTTGLTTLKTAQQKRIQKTSTEIQKKPTKTKEYDDLKKQMRIVAKHTSKAVSTTKKEGRRNITTLKKQIKKAQQLFIKYIDSSNLSGSRKSILKNRVPKINSKKTSESIGNKIIADVKKYQLAEKKVEFKERVKKKEQLTNRQLLSNAKGDMKSWNRILNIIKKRLPKDLRIELPSRFIGSKTQFEKEQKYLTNKIKDVLNRAEVASLKSKIKKALKTTKTKNGKGKFTAVEQKQLNALSDISKDTLENLESLVGKDNKALQEQLTNNLLQSDGSISTVLANRYIYGLLHNDAKILKEVLEEIKYLKTSGKEGRSKIVARYKNKANAVKNAFRKSASQSDKNLDQKIAKVQNSSYIKRGKWETAVNYMDAPFTMEENMWTNTEFFDSTDKSKDVGEGNVTNIVNFNKGEKAETDLKNDSIRKLSEIYSKFFQTKDLDKMKKQGNQKFYLTKDFKLKKHSSIFKHKNEYSHTRTTKNQQGKDVTTTHKWTLSKSQLRRIYTWGKNPKLRQVIDRQFGKLFYPAISKNLPQRDKNFALARLRFFEDLYVIKNTVSERVTGVPIGRRENYTPSSFNGYSQEKKLWGDFNYGGIVLSSAKGTVEHDLSLDLTLGDIAADQQAIDEISNYVAKVEQYNVLRSAVGSKEVAEIVAAKFGDRGKSKLKTLLGHIDWESHQGMNDVDRAKGLTYMRNTYVGNSIALKFKNAVNQITSTVLVLKELSTTDLKYLPQLSNDLATGKAHKFFMNVSSQYRNRGDNISRDISDAIKSSKLNSIKSIYIKLGDKRAILISQYIHYLKMKDVVRKDHPKWSDGKVLKEAIKIAEDYANLTQQSSYSSHLSFAQKSRNGFVRALTPYMNTPYQMNRQNIAHERALLLGKGSTLKNLKAILIFRELVPFMYQYIISGLPGVLSDWEEEDTKSLALTLVMGWWGNIPFLGDIIGYGANTVAGVKAYEPKNIFGNLFAGFGGAFDKIKKGEASLDDYWFRKDVAKMLDFVAPIPFSVLNNYSTAIGAYMTKQYKVLSGILMGFSPFTLDFNPADYQEFKDYPKAKQERILRQMARDKKKKDKKKPSKIKEVFDKIADMFSGDGSGESDVELKF